MRSVFADTFHFLALLKSDDPYHQPAVELHRIRWQRIVTTDCVLLETGDACCAPTDRDDFLALVGLKSCRKMKEQKWQKDDWQKDGPERGTVFRSR